MKEKFIIIGSGFAGLSLAIFLKKQGVDLTLYEANPGPQQWGGSITLFPNGMKIMSQLGLDEKVRELGITITHAHFKDHWGKTIVKRAVGTKALYGQPTVAIRRSFLFHLLLEEAQKYNVEIVYNKRLNRVTETPQGMVAHFDDQSSAEGRYLIGADGVNSYVRRYIEPNFKEPHYSQLIFFGGFVRASDIPRDVKIIRDAQEVYVGPRGFFGFSFIDKEETLLWYCYLPQETRLSKMQLDQLSDSEIKNRVVEAHNGWCQPIQKLIENSSTFSKANIYDILDLQQWSRGNALILGDAAHAIDPVSGQGASLAMEDSCLLAELISHRKHEPMQETFRLFEQLRRPRVSKLVHNARKSSERLKLEFGPLGCFFRNWAYALMIKITPEKKQNWAFQYDVRNEVSSLDEVSP